MDTASGLGDQSPILFKPVKKLDLIQTPNEHTLNLEEVHKRLLQHLRKRTALPRGELKTYLDQIQKMNPDDHKSRWLLMKIKGLLSYILKRRTDFHYSIVKGEITIFQKSASQQETRTSDIPEPPKFHSQPMNDSIALPSSFLTNNDFVTIEESQLMEMEVQNSNYSADLFATESLHSFSQENYQMLKSLTQSNEILGNDDNIFKIPQPVDQKLNKVYNLHDTLEETYNSAFSATPSLLNFENDQSGPKMGQNHVLNKTNFNVFDDLSITNDQLKEEFDREFEETEKWISEIIEKLINLQVEPNHTHGYICTEDKENHHPNEVESSGGTLPVQAYYSEANLQIIREVCSEFKKNLEEDMKKNKKLEVLREWFNTSS